MILLKPADFSGEAEAELKKLLGKRDTVVSDDWRDELPFDRKKLESKLYQRIGWQPRCKPTVLPSGRILLPLYSDTFSLSIMAISDDDGKTWYASKPLLGFGAIQPTVLRRDNGELVAYMRENGILKHIRTSTSKDEGLTWGPVTATDMPNPGSGLDGVRLANGHWLLVYNDTTKRPKQPRRLHLDRRRQNLEVETSPGKGINRLVPLPDRHPRPRRHDPRRLQLLRQRRPDDEARRLQRSLGASR